MARVKLSIPESVHYSTDLTVRVTDLNYGNHLGNEVFLAYAHEARVRFLIDNGYSEFDIEGSSIIQADAEISYKAEGHLGDRIKIDVSVMNFSSSGFEMYYVLHNLNTEKIMAIVKTSIVFYDYENGRINKVPENFRSKFKG